MAKRRREQWWPKVTTFQRWAAFARGALEQATGKITLIYRHPELRKEHDEGRTAAARGYVRVEDPAASLRLIQHVEAGNEPHTFEETLYASHSNR